jgi:hypothetical protein
MTTTNEEILKALDELKAASIVAKNILKGGPGSGPHQGGGGGSGASGRAPAGLVEQTREALKRGVPAMPKDVQARAARETEDNRGSTRHDYLVGLGRQWQQLSLEHAQAGEMAAARAADDLGRHVDHEAYMAILDDPMFSFSTSDAEHDKAVNNYTEGVKVGTEKVPHFVSDIETGE